MAPERDEKVRKLKSLYDRWNAEQTPPIVPMEAANASGTVNKAAAQKAARKNEANKP